MKKQLTTLLAVSCVTLFGQAVADEPHPRHGLLKDGENVFSTEAAVNITSQAASDSRLEGESFVSIDILTNVPHGDGKWTIYVEGNSTPDANGVSSLIGEANTDVGSALDRDGNGQLQVSEFHYTSRFNNSYLTMGLMDVAGYIDSSEVANDETTSFLNGNFVNNTLIELPDYTLGMSYHHNATRSTPGFTLLIAGSHGLADNPDASYRQLLDTGATEKGLFAAVQSYWVTDMSIWRVGIWTNTKQHEDLSDNSAALVEKANHGAYVTADYFIGEESAINFRLGVANEEVSEAANFFALSGETPLAGHMLGAAISQTTVSQYHTGGKDSINMELFWRLELNDTLQLTPSIQMIENSGLDGSETKYDSQLTLYALRLGYAF